MSYKAAVVCLSDRAQRGEREDISGKLLVELLTESGFSDISYSLLPDELELIEAELIRLSDMNYSLILTTGGTGLSKRDVTADATRRVIEREVPGISELIRAESFKVTKKAALSRGISGIRKSSLIINLPGSAKAVRESYEAIKDILGHALDVMTLDEISCGE